MRRYSFLLTLAAAAFFCYHVNRGNLGIHLGDKRGTMNSAWLGAVMTLVATTFLSLFAFYVVKDAVARDERTGVGQILAATPLSRAQYIFGKALSNFFLLASMVAVLAAAAPPLQLLAGEDPRLDFAALLSPFLFVALPAMALTAGLAVLFESIRPLRGGLGNVLYFFLFCTVLGVSVQAGLPDPIGINVFRPGMLRAARAADPSFTGEFGFGAGPRRAERGFEWYGVDWTPAQAAPVLLWPGISVGLCLLAARRFNRFDSAPVRPGMRRAPAEEPPRESRAPVRTTRLSPVTRKRSFGFLFVNELKLMLKGKRWWWYAGAAAAMITALSVPAPGLGYALAAAWFWPVLVWSGMGNRERTHSTDQFVFSAPHPVRRPLPAIWLAGVAVALALGSGAAVRLLSAADWRGLAGFLTGAMLAPSLAICLGVWTGGSKAFEVVYTVAWYVGPMSRLPAIDFTFTTNNRHLIPAYAIGVATLMLLAVAGRLSGTGWSSASR